MIKKLDIQNFQNHAGTILEFYPGLNIIMGSSDSGKSAILRALHWIIFNRPAGNAFKSYWGGVTRVSANIDDCIITKERDKTNTYFLDSSEFNAVQHDVPEEISRVINMDKTNIQAQFDPPFLLQESPGNVAQFFNRVSNLNSIDTGLAKLNSWRNKTNNNIEQQTAAKEELERDLDTYQHLDEFEIRVVVLESLEKQRNDLQAQYKILVQLIKDTTRVDMEIQRVERIVMLKDSVDNIFELLNKKQVLVQQQDTLQGIVSALTKTHISIAKLTARVSLQEQVDICLDKISVRNRLASIIDSLYDIDIDSTQVDLQAKQEQFDKELPNICPLCGQQTKKGKVYD